MHNSFFAERKKCKKWKDLFLSLCVEYMILSTTFTINSFQLLKKIMDIVILFGKCFGVSGTKLQ